MPRQLLSAFLDALTVVAVAVTVGMSFYEVFHRVASGKTHVTPHHDAATDEHVQVLHRENLEGFRAFLRSLMMHGAVGTAIGGVMTQVGEPQNLLIAEHAEWTFGQFFVAMAPVTVPVTFAGFATCWAVERFRLFGYGTPLPDAAPRRARGLRARARAPVDLARPAGRDRAGHRGRGARARASRSTSPRLA